MRLIRPENILIWVFLSEIVFVTAKRNGNSNQIMSLINNQCNVDLKRKMSSFLRTFKLYVIVKDIIIVRLILTFIFRKTKIIMSAK